MQPSKMSDPRCIAMHFMPNSYVGQVASLCVLYSDPSIHLTLSYWDAKQCIFETLSSGFTPKNTW